MATAHRSADAIAVAPAPLLGDAGSLDGIFDPKSVAIIGATEQPGTCGHKLLSTLIGGEFRGPIAVVHPGSSAVLGKPAYATLAQVPGNIHLVAAVTAPEKAPDVLAECVAKDVKAVLLISTGFGTGSEDRNAMIQKLQSILNGSRTRLIGPNSLGVMNPLIGLNATPGLQMPLGGTVAFLAESPILSRLVLDWSLKHVVGFSAFASLGAMLDVSWANLIDYFGRDPFTRTIVLQISSIRDARSFISAAREVSLDKPIIVVKTGRSEASISALAWKSHCAVVDDDVLTAALRRVGVLEVDTLEDLFYAADALSKQPRPQGARLMIASNADGAAVMAADSISRCGVDIAQPSTETRTKVEQLLPHEHALEDVAGDGSAENYLKAVEVLANDPNCDGLLLLMVPSAFTDPQRTAELLLQLRSACAKPMLMSYMGTADTPEAQQSLARACIPTFSSPEAAGRVFKYMWRYSYDLDGLYETPMLHSEDEQSASRRDVSDLIDSARSAGRTSLSPDESSQVLHAYGIPVHERPGRSNEQNAFHVKLGSRIDVQFGPILMFGSGDRGAHAYGEPAIGLPPLNATLARRMLEQSRFYFALRSECDSDSLVALERLLVRFSQLVAEQRCVREIEMDLLVETTQHAVVVGSRCLLHGPEVQEHELSRTAIRPYPGRYVSCWTMKNGQTVIIRPIRAEDEPLMVKFHEGLSDRSVYLRYFQRVKLRARTAHQRLARVCFLDYDRELALLAEHQDPQTGDREVIAIGTLQKEYSKNSGEVAVLISDTYQGQGLGKEVIARLVTFARDEGLQLVSATTMLENDAMCAVFRKLGFRLSTDFEDQLVHAELPLQ